MKVEMKKVVSSNIEEVGYSEPRKLMFIKFKGGSQYVYYNVKKELYDRLLMSHSVGGVLRSIVDGLEYKKLSGEQFTDMLVETIIEEKYTCVLRVLLEYYQKGGIAVDTDVVSITGIEVKKCETVYIVLVKNNDLTMEMQFILPLEIIGINAVYYVDDVVMGTRNIPVLVEK